MKHIFFVIISLCIIQSSLSQKIENSEIRILFHGIVLDANSLSPLSNSQIVINRIFSSVTGEDGNFALYVYRRDTVVFSRLGYKSTIMYVSDTLNGREFIAGIYMNTDTLSIGEVVIIPRVLNLKSEILNGTSTTSPEMENARYNVAISAYQGRNSINTLGDPAANYELLHQQQKTNAYEKGGIPSSQIVGLSPLLLIPAAYLLIHGPPDKPSSFKQQLSAKEATLIQKKYLETLKKRNQ